MPHHIVILLLLDWLVLLVIIVAYRGLSPSSCTCAML